MENIYTTNLLNAGLALSFMMLFLLFFYLAVSIRTVLDKYRIRYGFDREIEGSELNIKENERKQKRLNEIEKRFKKRTYRDIGEKKDDSN